MQLVFQCRQGHDTDAIRPSVGRIGQAAKDDQRRRKLSAVFDNLIPDAGQVLCRFLNLVCTELDLDAAPGSVRQLNHGIDLVARIVLVMIELRAEGFRVDLQITLSQSFK